MLGYGQTDKPTAIADYTLKKLADDLAALLNSVGISKVVRIPPPRSPASDSHLLYHNQIAIGHDWGSAIVSRFTLWHPDRVIAVAQ
jgi:soluble epoxide hydrolase/lipid-phosphate phosphatase